MRGGDRIFPNEKRGRMCWQREGRRVELATAKAMERARDSVNADGNDVYVGCKDVRGDTHTRRQRHQSIV